MPIPSLSEIQELEAKLAREGYAGPAVGNRPRHCEVLIALQRRGFRVRPTGNSETATTKKTIRIEWGSQYLGYVINGHGEALLGFHFRRPMRSRDGNAIPAHFDTERFASEMGVNVKFLRTYSSEGKHYLHILDVQAAVKLMKASAALVDPQFTDLVAIDDSEEAQFSRDMADLEARRPMLSPATYERLAKARRGQGKFREDLFEEFGNRCAVSGLDLAPVLRASHVLAWSCSESDEQRLDRYNGLLLAANLDALFDRYLISFTEDGQLLVAKRVSAAQLVLLGPVDGLSAPPRPQLRSYLAKHRIRFHELDLDV